MAILDQMSLIESLEQLGVAHQKLRTAFENAKEVFQAIHIGVETVSNVDNFNVKDERQLLKQTIDVATSHLSQLKTHLNMLTPINKLPTELLIRIILFTTPPIKEKSHPYISYTGVCRHWRSVIIHNPVFWTLIQPMSDPFAREVLQRSKSAELDVIVRDGYSLQFLSALQNLLMGESHRIRTLRLLVSHSELDQSLVQLVLSGKFLALQGLACLSSSIFPFLPVLTSSDCLETLECTLNDNIPLDQLTPIFRRLKNLNLTLSFFTGSALALVQSLDNNTTLQNLRLDADSIPSGLTIGQINLPELQFLSISHSSLLEYFQTPKLSTLDVYWKYPLVTTPNYSILEEFNFSSIRYLYLVYPCGEGAPFDNHCILGSKVSLHDEYEYGFSENIEYFYYCNFTPKGVQSALPTYNTDIFSDKFPRDYFHLKFENENAFDTALGPILSSVLPQLTNLKELYFSPYIDCGSRYKWDQAYLKLEEIFAPIPSVQKLVITHRDTFLSFIRVFRNPSLLPQLKVLFYTGGLDSENPDYMEKVGKGLTECLQLRQKASAHRLEFIAFGCSCPLTDTWLNELRNLGTRFVTEKPKWYLMNLSNANVMFFPHKYSFLERYKPR